MKWFLMLVSLMMSGLFPATIDRALTLAQNHDWTGAAAALDQAAAEDSALFTANNFPYLRGRIAENLKDWKRAQQEFEKIGADNPLHPLATWHGALAAIRTGNEFEAERLSAQLPADFPASLKMDLARIAPPEFALKIYRAIPTRESRFEQARLLNDKPGMWSLIHERNDDDVALESARLLANSASTPAETKQLAETYFAHRLFEVAMPLYQSLAYESTPGAAEARYQIARIQFLRDNFKAAIDSYRAITKDFAGTDWQKDSEYQIANSYWRLGDYKASERAYLDYIVRFGGRGSEDGAIRNLVDVYRVMGDNTKALAWIDKGLARKVPLASRQVLIFTKAKILYSQKRFGAAALLFRQLGKGVLKSAPGGTTRDEAHYFEALSLSRAGNTAAAKTIWRDLASDPQTYYGIKAEERLGTLGAEAGNHDCSAGTDKTLATIQSNLNAARRPLRSALEAATSSDAVSELLFLQLWDEASLWNERQVSRATYRTAAEIAYAAGRYHRAIAFADRLPQSDATRMGLRFPAGFREILCTEAGKNRVDPLWLHAIIWQESKYNPFARSGASARGLMQFIPETANAVGAEIGIAEFSLDRLYDPTVNIPMGAHYFAGLLKELKNPVMALAAYNGGIDNVRRWKSKWPAGDEDFFVADIGFIETKRYVMAVYGAHAAYGALQ